MGEMLHLGTKQTGGKILPHSDLRGGVFLEEASCNRKFSIDGWRALVSTIMTFRVP